MDSLEMRHVLRTRVLRRLRHSVSSARINERDYGFTVGIGVARGKRRIAFALQPHRLNQLAANRAADRLLRDIRQWAVTPRASHQLHGRRRTRAPNYPRA